MAQETLHLIGGFDFCAGTGWLDNGEPRRIAFGGLRVDDAIEEALLAVVGPGAVEAAIAAWDTCLVVKAIGADVAAAATDLMKSITPAKIEE